MNKSIDNDPRVATWRLAMADQNDFAFCPGMPVPGKGAKAYAEAFATDGMVRVGDLPTSPGMSFDHHPAKAAIQAAQGRSAALDRVAYYPARLADDVMKGVGGAALLAIAYGLGAYRNIHS